MHFYIFSSDPKGPRQRESTISDEVVDEPPEEEDHSDTDDDLVLSFEIISEEEVARLKFPFLLTSSSSSASSMSSSSPSSASISSQGSNSSLGSTGTGDYNPHPPKPSVINPKRFFRKWPPKLSLPPLEEKSTTMVATTKGPPPELTEEEMMSPTARIWYIIQLKGHYNHGLEESEEEDSYFYHHPPLTMGDHGLATMEDSSTKMTGWFSSLLHLPQKIKQHQADKHRFNVNTSSPEVREQLKHLYVY